MRIPSFERRSVVFASTLAATLAVAASASAGAYSFTTIERPGIGCRTASPNVTPWGAELRNNDSRTQDIWCPLDQSGGITSAWVSVSPGWASPQSCTLSITSTSSNSGWFISGNTVNHDAQNNTDGVGFSSVPSAGDSLGAAITCGVPPGATLFDYHARENIYFDYITNW